MPDAAHPTARIVLAAEPFDQTLDYFTGRLGFRIDVISPADDPDRATLSRPGAQQGLAVVLDRYADPASSSASLELTTSNPDLVETTETAPNGTVVLYVPERPRRPLPPLQPALVVSRHSDTAAWVTGRAGMQYRDLIPDRQGGRFIASHIKVPGSGPVPDWVHHHDIHFQIIFCRSGAATLVYEDQGEPFRFEAGDCVLQPPGIRHRVLETFDDMQVVELGCPARHDTYADHDMELPTGRHLPDRDYNGQRFVHFVAAHAEPSISEAGPWSPAGWHVYDTGIAKATGGVGSVRVITATTGTVAASDATVHDGDLLFLYVLDGTVTLTVDGLAHLLAADDSAVVPAGVQWSAAVDASADSTTVRLLEVSTVQFQP